MVRTPAACRDGGAVSHVQKDASSPTAQRSRLSVTRGSSSDITLSFRRKRCPSLLHSSSVTIRSEAGSQTYLYLRPQRLPCASCRRAGSSPAWKRPDRERPCVMPRRTSQSWRPSRYTSRRAHRVVPCPPCDPRWVCRRPELDRREFRSC